MAEVFMGAMGTWETGKRPTLDNTGETMPLRDAGDIDQIADFEQIGGLDLLANFILRHIVKAKFAQHFKGALAGLRHMALLGFVDPLRLLAAKANLQRGIAILGRFFLLHDNTGSGLHHRHRNTLPSAL